MSLFSFPYKNCSEIDRFMNAISVMKILYIIKGGSSDVILEAPPILKTFGISEYCFLIDQKLK